MPGNEHDRTIPAGTLLANTYRIGDLIGRGGMGEVYEAYHARTGATFAVKVLLSDFSRDDTIRARFKREAEVSSRLQHPNIVRVFDFDDTPDGRPFLAMERLRGRELASYVAPGHPMALPEVVRIFTQVTSALRAAHEAGVIHRDLKPSNIFVEAISAQDQAVVKVLDFGISKVRDSTTHATQAAHILGTPHYMSPEQALGKKEIDQRSDIFALGVIAYELLTGRRAFGPEDPDAVEPLMNVLFRVVHVEPRPFADWGVVLPRVESVVMRAMAKDPAVRHADAASLGLAFREAAEGVKAGAPALAGPIDRRPLVGVTQALPASTLSGATGEELRSLRARPRSLEPATERTAGRRSSRTMWLMGALALGTAGLTALAIDLVRTPSRQLTAPSRPETSATPAPSPRVSPVRARAEITGAAAPDDDATIVVPPADPPVAARPNDTDLAARRAHAPAAERLTARDRPSHARREGRDAKASKDGKSPVGQARPKSPEPGPAGSSDATTIRNEDI